MTPVREGQIVAWSSLAIDGHGVGDEGRLLSVAGSCAHVTWSTGLMSGVTEVVSVHDISATASRDQDPLADSLDFGGLVSSAARDVYEAQGPEGVVGALSATGHLSSFEQIAEEALALVASRVRSDPSLREAVSTLDDEDAEAVVRLASAVLIRDAFGTDE